MNNFNDKINEYINIYQKINIIYIDSDIVRNAGFNNANTGEKLSHFPDVTSWDKSLYYFTSINLDYNNIWFIEDDCFFLTENTIYNIDNEYTNSDLLTRSNNIIYGINPNDWHWNSIIKYINSPYSTSLIQTCRLSKKLLLLIKDYVNIHNRLFLIEAMFNTIASQNNLIIDTPDELSKLECINYNYLDNINEYFVYHALKNHQTHKIIRDNYYTNI